VLALTLLLTAAATAADATPLNDCIQQRLSAIPSAPDGLALLDRARAICFDIADDEQRLRNLETNEKTHRNQLFQNNVLLFMVVAITLSGIVLSALQLWASYKLALAGHGLLADGGDINLQTNNVAVKSSVVGVVILGISLAFFALFVMNVYQIKTNPERSSAPAGFTPVPR
jgi:hypothetical protein